MKALALGRENLRHRLRRSRGEVVDAATQLSVPLQVADFALEFWRWWRLRSREESPDSPARGPSGRT
ncbi:MAG TPA: hypothetical protein VK477_13335 [Acidobacteriota bacterium]|nr:hypothetical protein [Acidobacteriota bacterium]